MICWGRCLASLTASLTASPTLAVVMLTVVIGCDGERPASGQTGFRVAAILGETPAVDDRFARAVAPRRFDFPGDHGAHRSYRSEWWYLTTALRDAAGNAFGAQVTVFRQSLEPLPFAAEGWSGQSVFMAHAAVTDVARQIHVSAERFGRDRPEIAGVSTGPFAAWVDGWALRSQGGDLLPLRVSALDREIGIELEIDAGGRLLLQGEAGLSRKGKDNASYYYSMTRLPVRGQLRVADRQVAVEGLGWLDREWSTSVLGAEHEGWDWFALQLDDGTDVMVYRLRRRDGGRDAFDAGLMVYPDGSERVLAAPDFTLTPLEIWTDGQGVAWPLRWRLDILDRQLLVAALVDDQVMETLVRYWEGLIEVRGPRGQPLGMGYMELTGYR